MLYDDQLYTCLGQFLHQYITILNKKTKKLVSTSQNVLRNLPRESAGSIGKARAFVTLSFRKNDPLQLSIQLNYSTEITSAQHTAECRLQSRV